MPRKGPRYLRMKEVETLRMAGRHSHKTTQSSADAAVALHKANLKRARKAWLRLGKPYRGEAALAFQPDQ